MVAFNQSDCNLSTLKVSSTGTKTWTKLAGGSSSDYGKAVVVDSARNVYVSGYTEGALPGATSLGSLDGFLMKYDKDGVQQWLIQFGSSGDDYALGLQIDSNDMLYPALQTSRSMEGTNLGSNDIVVMQVDSTGSVLSTEQFGTSGDDRWIFGQSANPVAVDSSGDLFITGFTSGSFTGYSNQGSNDLFLYKVEAKSTTTSSTTSTSSSTSTSITATSTTSSSTTSDTITLSTTSTVSSSSTCTVTSTSTSSRTLAAVAK